VEELYGTRYQSGSFSLINVGSGFHCLRSFFSFFCTWQHVVTFYIVPLNGMLLVVYQICAATFSIKNMLSASKSPLAFNIHLIKHQTVLFILSQGVNTISSVMITERHNVACRLIMKAISKGSLAGCIAQMDAGSTDRFLNKTFKLPSILLIGLYPFDFWIYPFGFDARLSVTGLLPVALMLSWLLPYLLNLNYLPLPTCNRCIMLGFMDKCAELTSLTLIRGRYTS